MKNRFKKTIAALVVSAFTLIFSSCGTNYALIANHNLSNTQVQLGSNNFKVIGKVSGSSETSYVFFCGGNKKRQMYENAYAKMTESANLTNSSKAIINVVTEEFLGGAPPFYMKRTITVSGYVVEFTK